jgi:hypothetical protein
MLLEGGLRGIQSLRRPAEIAGSQRDLRLRHDASGTRYRLSWPKGTRSTSQECLRSRKIAQLSHRDASERQSGGIVAQGDPLEGAEGVA